MSLLFHLSKNKLDQVTVTCLHWFLQHHFVMGCLQKKGIMIKV